MTSLRPPGLGPIVGHTTDTTCRLWIRAEAADDDGARLDADRRTLGVLGVVDPKGRVVDAFYFRLHREFDRTGTFVLGSDVSLGEHATDRAEEQRARPKAKLPAAQQPTPLKPGTTYRVRMGTLTLDDPLPDAERLLDWQLRARLPAIGAIKQDLMGRDFDASEAVFRTFPSSHEVAGHLTFLMGSCRYPGLLWRVKEADRIFGPMLDHFVDDGRFKGPAQFTLMVGDQIYADQLHRAIPLMRAETYEEFQSRYHDAMSAPNLARLLRRSPTYMILDDHEIEDNWTQDRLHERGNHSLFNAAISAYMAYQWSHGPRTYGRLLYYRFAAAGYPFFVVDARTQRFHYEPGRSDDRGDDAGLRNNHLLGRPTLDPNPAHQGQLLRLVDWLEQQQRELGDAPKFVVTATVFVPNAIDERIDPSRVPPGTPVSDDALLYEANRRRREASDSWAAFPNSRLELLRRIVERGIQNVVFLSGDVHCSNVAEIRFEGTTAASKLRAFSVTSSAFYWPFPFADGDPNSFVHDSKAKGQEDPFPIPPTGATMHYRSYGFTQEDNFCRLELDREAATLTVRVFDRDGVPVEVASEHGELVMASVLKLARW
jgi:alkaline phosphatase D